MSGQEIIILALIFCGIIFFVIMGVELFSQGWESYEEKYASGAEKTLDSMYITMPAQHIAYLSLASFLSVSFFVYLLFGQWLTGLILGSISFFGPQIAIKYMKYNRDKTFGIQLIDALASMSNALKAGLSLAQAFEMIHEEMDNPISQEFQLLTHEIHFGTPVAEALDSLRQRMVNQDLSLMVTSILVAQEVGGNLGAVFENIANTIRERHQIEAKIKALTAQGKMQGIVLTLVPIGLGTLLTVFYPDMMAPLFNTWPGMILMAICIVMMGIGGFFISRIVRIDV